MPHHQWISSRSSLKNTSMPFAVQPTGFLVTFGGIYGTLAEATKALCALVLQRSENSALLHVDYDVEEGNSPKSCFIKIKSDF